METEHCYMKVAKPPPPCQHLMYFAVLIKGAIIYILYYMTKKQHRKEAKRT